MSFQSIATTPQNVIISSKACSFGRLAWVSGYSFPQLQPELIGSIGFEMCLLALLSCLSLLLHLCILNCCILNHCILNYCIVFIPQIIHVRFLFCILQLIEIKPRSFAEVQLFLRRQHRSSMCPLMLLTSTDDNCLGRINTYSQYRHMYISA